uniref:Uncharacterized protein n=1 Tax=Panagrolaimus superbus TaxID=310955 RepID=A0A914YN44_9BILA
MGTEDFMNDDNYMAQRPLKKYHKFDEKIDKTKSVDEAMIYDDEGNLIQYQTSVSPSSQNDPEKSASNFEEKQNNNFDDVRVPQDSTINEQIEKPAVISDDNDYHEATNNNNNTEEDKDYDPVAIPSADTETASTISFVETLEPTPTFESETFPPPTVKTMKPKHFEPTLITEPSTTTPDPREEEFKNLQEQMKLLEKEVLQIRGKLF